MLALDGILCFSYAPLYAVAIIGLVIIAAAFVFPAGWLAITQTQLPLIVWTISAITLLFGLQTLLLGIIGSYIARIFDEVRARPVYVVSDLVGKPFDAMTRKTPQRERNYRYENDLIAEFDANPKPSIYIDKPDYLSGAKY